MSIEPSVSRHSATGGVALWLACVLATGVAAVRAASLGSETIPSMRLPAEARKPSLFALKDGFGIIAAYNTQMLSPELQWYSCRLALSRISHKCDGLVAPALADFWSRQVGQMWPECAVMESDGLVMVAFQEMLDSGAQVVIGTVRRDGEGGHVLEGREVAVRTCDVSAPESFSFIGASGTGERPGLVGVDAYGRVWVSIRRSDTAEARKKWSVWSRITEASAPSAAFVGDKTLLIFSIAQRHRDARVVQMLRCEWKDNRWQVVDRSDLLSGSARRTALLAKGEGLFLLIGQSKQAAHRLDLLVSEDGGKKWTSGGHAELAIQGGVMTALALSEDCSSAGVILESEQRECKVTIVPLRKPPPE